MRPARKANNFIAIYEPVVFTVWNPYRLLAGKPEDKRPLERPRTRWVNNIKMNL
jgi:hypothetical protein